MKRLSLNFVLQSILLLAALAVVIVKENTPLIESWLFYVGVATVMTQNATGIVYTQIVNANQAFYRLRSREFTAYRITVGICAVLFMINQWDRPLYAAWLMLATLLVLVSQTIMLRRLNTKFETAPLHTQCCDGAYVVHVGSKKMKVTRAVTNGAVTDTKIIPYREIDFVSCHACGVSRERSMFDVVMYAELARHTNDSSIKQ